MEKIYGTDTFLADLKQLDFVGEVINDTENYKILISDTQKQRIAEVSTKIRYMFNTTFSGFHNLKTKNQEIIQQKISQYMKTPIDQRTADYFYVIPIFGANGNLQPKYLWQAQNGLTLRILKGDIKKLIATNQVDSGFIFSEADIARIKSDPKNFINFDGKIEINKSNS